MPRGVLAERAPAKINLTLHIPRRRSDGWHELVSLVAFAGTGDHLSLTLGEPLALDVSGPTGREAGPQDQNLVLRAARNLGDRVAGLRLGRFHLNKRLPVASGIGGGSSDAAAALRLLADANGLSLEDPAVVAAARATGADVPVCLAARARIMQGVGERLGPVLRLPSLFAVLVNPRQPLETKAVFARMGLRPGGPGPAGRAHPPIEDAASHEILLAALAKARNDMEDAASVLLPVIVDQLAILSAAPGCRLARMSGSGATCFGLFETCHAASAAARVIRQAHPEWWVKPTVLR